VNSKLSAKPPMSAKVIIIGSGGHARVLAETLRLCGASVLGFTEKAPSPGTVDGLPILGDDSILPELLLQGVTAVVGLGGVSDNRPRARAYEMVKRSGMALCNVVHPSAAVSPSAVLGDGVVVLARAVVGTRATIGNNVVLNTGAQVDHDCVIGDHVHIAPGAVLSGDVSVGEYAHIGTGAVIIQGVNIGKDAVVAAGSVVTKDVPAGTTVVGVPAQPLSRRAAQ